MKDKQPKDFVEIETFEEFLDSGYKNLNALEKVTYSLQDHVWKVIFVCASGGYLAGTHFGVFW